MQTMLVTGGAGFIGSELVRQWIAEESPRVVNLDKLTYAGHLDSLAEVAGEPRHVFIPGDVADAAMVARLLHEYQPAAVVHLAAESHVDRSIDAPAAFVQTNVVGTHVLLDACRCYWSQLSGHSRENFRFVYVSTDEVFGALEPDEAPFAETSPVAPNSPYAASKAAGEHFVRAYWRTYGLPAIVTRGSNTYGPYQLPEKLIPLATLNALDGRPIPIYGDGRQVRDWVHVNDHCRAIRRVLADGQPGKTYNIGAHCERTNLEVAEMICDTVERLRPTLPHRPCRSLITPVADRPGHDRRYAIDAGKILQLGWTPQTNFTAGLEHTVRWYLDHGDWVERVTASGCGRRRRGLGPDRHNGDP